MAELFSLINPAVPGRRVLLLGDSITALNSSYSTAAWPATVSQMLMGGYFTWCNRFLNHRLAFDVALNKGVNSDTTALMLARFTADVVANYASFDIAFMLAGTNDIENGVAAATTIANIQSMVNSMLLAGKVVVLYAIIPRTSIAADATKRAKWSYINRVLHLWARTKAGVLFVDCTRDMADPTSSTGAVVSTCYEATGTHPSTLGAYYMGKRAADLLSPLLADTPDFLASAADVYDATYNPFGNKLSNPAFITGSGGTASAPCTGTVVAGGTLAQIIGSFTAGMCVGSVEAQAAGIGAVPGNKQVITWSVTTKSAFEGWQFVFSATGYSAGDVLIAEAEVDISNILRVTGFGLYLGESDNVSFPSSGADGDGYGDGVTFIPTTNITQMKLRTPPYIVQANGRTIYWGVNMRGVGTVACSATVKIGGAKLSKVA